ncbi:MAG: hypothetical protein GDA50_00835 [Alphaproteobacteria bacterium GM202ARS2]|nr:hypothetical protein [Alphaproteobacteria bacterium GM202ARS2]
MVGRPWHKPRHPSFASGPAVKPSSWRLSSLDVSLLGRYHRTGEAVSRLRSARALLRELLMIPPGHRLVPMVGSASGAMESALWALLEPRYGVCALVWEHFGKLWANIAAMLVGDKLSVRHADYGQVPNCQDMTQEDVLFAWNGTTAGAWIGQSLPFGERPADGLVFCDATSVVFMHPLPWEQLDVVAFSLQKALGCEAFLGWLVLSEKAQRRLAARPPATKAAPHLLSLTDEHATLRMQPINSTSLLLLEDLRWCLDWAQKQGGVASLASKAWDNHRLMCDWVSACPWVDFLVPEAAHRPPAPLTLRLTDEENSEARVQALCALLAQQGAAYDIQSHPQAPCGLRIWTGPTVETDDLQRLCQWLTWGYAQINKQA